MHDGGELNTRNAVQSAIKNQRVEIIKLLLSQVVRFPWRVPRHQPGCRTSPACEPLLSASPATPITMPPVTPYRRSARQNVNMIEELDVVELYRSLLYSERVFRNSAVLTELLESSLAYSTRGKVSAPRALEPVWTRRP